MRWRCRGRNEVTGVANVQFPLPEIKAFPFNSTNKKLLSLQPENLLKSPSPSLFPLFIFSIFFSLLSFHFSPNTQNFLRSKTLPPLSLFFKLSLSSPLAFTILTEFPPRIQREVLIFFPSFGFYIRPLCSSRFHSFSHAFSSGKQPLNLETTLPNNSPHQFSMQADSFKFSACFTTKDPYGFMVGCKETKPRPKMDPQYSPIPIWSLWAQSI